MSSRAELAQAQGFLGEPTALNGWVPEAVVTAKYLPKRGIQQSKSASLSPRSVTENKAKALSTVRSSGWNAGLGFRTPGFFPCLCYVTLLRAATRVFKIKFKKKQTRM